MPLRAYVASWTIAPPGFTAGTSVDQVFRLRATRMSMSRVRHWYPCGDTLTSNQVGRPSMFEGKTFLGATGMPMRKIALVSTRFDD